MLDKYDIARYLGANYCSDWELVMHSEPWVIAPQLQKERLLQIARLLVEVRGEVIDRHEPELGDTRLSLGMRAYECCRSRIIFKAEEQGWPWLSILTPEGRFTFAIDGVPVRFSRNDPSQLPDRKLLVSDEASRQMSFFDNTTEYAHLRWFLIIDTPYDVPVDNAYLVGYSDQNEILCKWQIPLEDIVSTLHTVHDVKPEPIDIPAAKPRLRIVKENRDTEETV